MIDKRLLNNHLGRMVGISSKFFRKQLGENVKESGFDLTSEQMIILVMLSQNEGVNQQTMSEFLFTDKTAITRWIDSLEKMELVKRVPDREDRRQNLIYLTDKGKQMLLCLKDVALKTEADAVVGIEPEKVEICKEVLKKVIRNLNDGIDISDISIK